MLNLRIWTHEQAETVIQMMVMTGIILLLSARMLKRKEHTPNGISFGRMFGYVVLPCALLGLWATLFFPTQGHGPGRPGHADDVPGLFLSGL